MATRNRMNAVQATDAVLDPLGLSAATKEAFEKMKIPLPPLPNELMDDLVAWFTGTFDKKPQYDPFYFKEWTGRFSDYGASGATKFMDEKRESDWKKIRARRK